MFSAVSVCLSVCVFVCQYDNFRTIKRIWRLGALYKNLDHVRMSRSKVKGQGYRRQKDEKVRHFVREWSSGRGPLRRLENQRMLSSL